MAKLLEPLTRRPQIPAWAISTLVHSLLVLMLLFWVARIPQGAAETTLRDVGIVLKSVTAEGEKFEGEEADSDTPAASSQQNPSTIDPVEALPNASEASRASDVLPELPDGLAAAEAAAALPSAGGMAASGAGLRGSRAGVGGEATTSVFGVEGTGNKFLYVFDRSPSMEGAPLAAAKQQLIESLGPLEPTHQFQIIFFSTEPVAFDITGQNRIAFANEQNKKKAEHLVNSISTFGGTDRQAALLAALAYEPDVIFFLTDAEDTMPAAELDRVVDRNRRIGATINTIEFGRGPGGNRENFLSALSTATEGKHGYVDTTTLGRR
jgi:hypothetical protein